MTELYIVRHGQTIANRAGLKQGTINDDRTLLSAEGLEQAQDLAAVFHPLNLTALYQSPLRRTVQTARILNQKLNLPVITDQRLLEISYGDWDGQDNAKLEAQYPALFYSLIHDVRPNYAQVAHGESFDHVRQRVLAFTKDIVKTHPNDRLLIVTHGFTVRSFAANATNIHGLEILEPENCSVSKIVVEPQTLEQHLVYYSRPAKPHF
ncbi:histidine phosphatase family protein [Limosilactobacillus kribbianus]|uniref:histidine phosphatase family protein n=1 Tax=Limosilactobacillus kribbianus TaxID=2982695 RepID=UPI002263B188|nr:histidine phosphatase family protein [Limosilactobacillus kribbianus]